jgi:hypothetical protein
LKGSNFGLDFNLGGWESLCLSLRMDYYLCL